MGHSSDRKDFTLDQRSISDGPVRSKRMASVPCSKPIFRVVCDPDADHGNCQGREGVRALIGELRKANRWLRNRQLIRKSSAG